MKLRKILIAVLTVILSAVCVTAMTACQLAYRPSNYTYETEYFFYEYDYSSGELEIRILELTDLGMRQKALIIPGEISGHRVRFLGGKSVVETDHTDYKIISERLKKIYVNDDTATAPCGRDILQKNQVTDVIILSFNLIDSEPTILWYADEHRTVYLSRNLYESDDYSLKEYVDNNEYVKIANIEFYIDQEDTEPYFVDGYSKDGIYIKPENPQKSGYRFLGWFDETLKEWDGEYPQSADEKLTLHARWLKEDQR